MSLLDGLRKRVKDLAKRAVTLPVLNAKLLEDPLVERQFADLGVVPQRCGLCKHYQPQDMADTLRLQRAFAQAADLLTPSVMGHVKGATKSIVGSEAARALRPHLSNEWKDYGGCGLNPGQGVWAFAEQPQVGDANEPCARWT